MNQSLSTQIDNLVRATHAKLWPLFHGSPAPYNQATLTINHNNDDDSGYDIKNDKIILNIPPGNLTLDALSPDDWPVWMIDLVEEMLHERQAKDTNPPSSSAKQLHGLYWKKFFGPGHDEKFFAAIEQNAHHFQMTPEKLIAVLCGVRP